MKKVLYIFLFPILVMALTGCGHEDPDVIDIDRYFTGKWEMIGEPQLIYDISRKPNSSSYFGTITTYHLTDGDHIQYASKYSWCIFNPDIQAPMLELVNKEELNEDDPWAGSYYYTIIKLNSTEMWWDNNKQILKFARRTDL